MREESTGHPRLPFAPALGYSLGIGTRSERLLPWLLLALAAPGCGSSRRAQEDAGTAPDAGPTDAGEPPDAGSDAGGDVDAGPCPPGFVMCDRAEAAGLLVSGSAYGRGAAWIDVDGDGWEDLWQSDTGTAYAFYDRTSRMFRNRGDGTFEPMDLGIAPEDMFANWTGTWGDYDNDGDPDLFLVNGGYSRPSATALYRNDLSGSGRFTPVSEEAGIRPDPQQWWGAAFADYDGDSFLDLAVTSEYGPLVVYHNEGDGTFAERSGDLGFEDPIGDTKNPVWFDYDRDGDPDLYVASVDDHRFFRNDGGTFTDMTDSLLVPTGTGTPVFSASAADFDQDGWEDLYLGRWDREDFVLLNRGGTFEKFGQDIGLDMANFPETSENTMGLGVGDLNADGWPDVLIGTGRPDERGFPMIYCHEGTPLRFHRCSDEVIAGQGLARNHAVVLADPDHDGDTDVFWSLGGHVEHDIQNGTDTTDLPAYYVRYGTDGERTAVVHLVGTVSNRAAIGAHLEVAAGSQVRHYWIHGMQGFQGQNSDWLPVSLGDAGRATVTVDWPAGGQSAEEVVAGDRVEIVE